jgi:hypothetical protein
MEIIVTALGATQHHEAQPVRLDLMLSGWSDAVLAFTPDMRQALNTIVFFGGVLSPEAPNPLIVPLKAIGLVRIGAATNCVVRWSYLYRC